MDPQAIAFALITYYPKWYRGRLRSISHIDKIRGDIALKFIQKAISLNYQVVVVDGRSSKSFRKEISKYKKVVKILKRKVPESSPAKRQAFKAASKLISVKAIIACEPEKVSLIDSAQIIAQPILNNEVEIVIPKRNEKLFKESYPDYMYESETEGNKIYNEQLKSHNILPKNSSDFDMFFGPRAFANNKKNLKLFTEKFLEEQNIDKSSLKYFDPEKYSNTLYFPIIIALKNKLKVKSIEIPFIYPKSQKENEEKGAREFFIEKRRVQKLGTLLELEYLLNNLKK